jgi:2'-5' RNA ligase
MKLSEILTEFKRSEAPEGVYVGLHFDQETRDKVKKFLDDNKIPNPIDVNKLHTTVLYSRKPVDNLQPMGQLDPAMCLKCKELEVFPTQDGKRALVMRVENDQLVKRHNEFIGMGGTSDYPEFKPHVTLSYDIGKDYDHSHLSVDELDSINAVEEYSEPLKLDWSKS